MRLPASSSAPHLLPALWPCRSVHQAALRCGAFLAVPSSLPRRLVTRPVLGRAPRLPVSTWPPAVWDMRTRSSGTHPPPTLLLLWTEPVQGGPLPPRRHPSFTKAGLRPPVRGSTWRASREGLAPTSCSVNINRINHRTSRSHFPPSAPGALGREPSLSPHRLVPQRLPAVPGSSRGRLFFLATSGNNLNERNCGQQPALKEPWVVVGPGRGRLASALAAGQRPAQLRLTWDTREVPVLHQTSSSWERGLGLSGRPTARQLVLLGGL